MLVCMSAHMQIFPYLCMQVCNYAIIQAGKYVTMQLCKFANKYASIQIGKFQFPIWDLLYETLYKLVLKPSISCKKIVTFRDYSATRNFSELSDQNDLTPLEYCQASSDTSLEYPLGLVWWKLKITIFCLAGP